MHDHILNYSSWLYSPKLGSTICWLVPINADVSVSITLQRNYELSVSVAVGVPSVHCTHRSSILLHWWLCGQNMECAGKFNLNKDHPWSVNAAVCDTGPLRDWRAHFPAAGSVVLSSSALSVISRNHLIWRELFSHSSGPFPWSGPYPITGPRKSGKTQTSYPNLARDSSKLLRLHHRHSSPSAASHFLLSPWQVLILRSSLTSFLHADSHPKVCFTGNLTCNTKPIWVSLHPKMTC